MGREITTVQCSNYCRALWSFLFAVLFTTACTAPIIEPTPQDIGPQDLTFSVAQTESYLQLAGQPEEIPVENCGGERDSTQTLTRSRSLLTALQIEISETVAGELGGDVKVAEALIRAEIGTQLGVRFGTETQISSALEIVTPPGRRSLTTVQWNERWTKGDVSIIRSDGTYVDVLPFLALNSLVLEQQGVVLLTCDDGDAEVIEEVTEPEFVPPLPPLIPATPTPVILGTITVPGNSNEGYTFRAQVPGQYVFRYISGAYSVYPPNSDSIPEDFDPWLSDIRAFKNRPIQWNGEDISETSDFRIINLGYNATAEGAEQDAREFSAPVTISLAQGDVLHLVGVDKRSSYNDNPGEVVLEVLFYPLP